MFDFSAIFNILTLNNKTKKTTFHAPQIIYIILTICGLFALSFKHGQTVPETQFNAIPTIISTFLIIGLLYWGGFFR